MMINRLKSNRLIKSIYVLLMTYSLFACKKKNDEDSPANISPTTGTRTEFTLDSIFLYAKEIYYWQEALPDYATFNPRAKYAGITPDIYAFQKELYDITQYKLNANGFPYEKPISGESPRYSYLENKNNLSPAYASLNMGTGSTNQIQNKTIEFSKVGYLYIDAFKNLNEMKAKLDKDFEDYATTGIETLIIDLRNNRGGTVETVAYLANLIAPSSFNGKIMFSELFNPILRSGNAKILKNQLYLDENGKPVKYNGRLATLADIDFSEAENIEKFGKIGKLETVKNLYFIVTNQTASASELLISSFKPHLPVRLVGQKTYGKPVGFFAVNIDKYSIYMASFLLRNADGWSDYFDGIVPDIIVNGGSSGAIGDPTELYFATVLKDIMMKSGLAANRLSLKTSAKIYSNRTISDPNRNDQDIPLIKKHFRLKN